MNTITPGIELHNCEKSQTARMENNSKFKKKYNKPTSTPRYSNNTHREKVVKKSNKLQKTNLNQALKDHLDTYIE